LRPPSAGLIVKKTRFVCLLENGTMRYTLASTLFLFALSGFAAAAPAKPPLELVDEGLPLQELRPLDRRVYVLTLYGRWNQAPATGAHYVNFFFPNGGSYSHRVQEEELFRKGELRCVIQGPQLIRNGVSNGGKFTVVISANQPVRSPTAPEVISNALEESWPMQRPVSRFRPYTKYSEKPPVDIFPIPGEILPPPPGLKRPEKP
jgi:hypothetical protein